MLYLLAQDNNFSKITLNGVSKSSDFSKRDSTRLSDRVVLIPLSLRGKEFVRIESSLLDIQFTRLINDRSYKQRKLQMINRTKRRMIGDDRWKMRESLFSYLRGRSNSRESRLNCPATMRGMVDRLSRSRQGGTWRYAKFGSAPRIVFFESIDQRSGVKARWERGIRFPGKRRVFACL